MLVEDFDMGSIPLHEFIINECKRLGCMTSLKMFLDDHELFLLDSNRQFDNDFGVHKIKPKMKSKDYSQLVFKETDALMKNHHNYQFMSRGVSITTSTSNHLVFIPDDSKCVEMKNFKTLIDRKNKHLIRRLNQHLTNKTSLDTFEIGKIIAMIDIHSPSSVISSCDNMSHAYAKIVNLVPNGHEIIAKYYLKPLTTFMEQYISSCTSGGIDLLNELDSCMVDSDVIIYVNCANVDVDALKIKLKERMHGYVQF